MKTFMNCPSWIKHVSYCFQRFGFPNRGNALFLVLIAVALFAALSYAITSSSRSGSGSVSKEQAVLNVSRVMQDVEMVRQSVQRMKMINGCRDEQISFYGLAGTWDCCDINSLSPGDGSCHVTNVAGGNLKRLVAPDDIFSPAQVDRTWRLTRIENADVNWPTATMGLDDYFLRLDDVTDEFCMAVSRQAGLTSIPSRLSNAGGQGLSHYNQAAMFGCNNCFTTAGLSGRDTFCAKNQGNNTKYFYALILAR